jgi:hypothetical protein
MNFRLTGLLVALSAIAVVATPGEARADYIYTTSNLTLNPAAPPALGQTIAVLPAGTVPDSAPALAAVLAVTYNPTAAVNGFSQTISFTETLTGTPGTETVGITATLNVLFAGPNGVLATLSNVSTTVLTGSGYEVPANFVTYASISPTGKLAEISIGISPVPEPASLAMVAMGLGAVGFVGFRRTRRTA